MLGWFAIGRQIHFRLQPFSLPLLSPDRLAYHRPISKHFQQLQSDFQCKRDFVGCDVDFAAKAKVS